MEDQPWVEGVGQLSLEQGEAVQLIWLPYFSPKEGGGAKGAIPAPPDRGITG